MLTDQKPLRVVAGFTLIELMIAVAIFGIVSSFGIASYRIWIQNVAIRNSAESILNGIQLARAEAVNRNTPIQFNFRTGAAWTVCQRPALPGDCPDPDGATTIQSRLQSEGSSATVTVDNLPGGTNRIVFNSLGVVDISAGSFTQTEINNTALAVVDSRRLRVTVNVGGNVRMCDPKFIYPADPRGC